MNNECGPGGPLERLVSGHSIDDLLWAYWDAAYVAGQANRTTDDETGTAQEILYAIQLKVREMVAAEREACAKVCEELRNLYLADGRPAQEEAFLIAATMDCEQAIRAR